MTGEIATLAAAAIAGGCSVWGASRLADWLTGSSAEIHETRDTWAAMQRNALDGERIPTPPPVLRPGVGLTPKRRSEP